MKTLDEIETDYVNNIIEFFCKEMPTHHISVLIDRKGISSFYELKYKV